MNRKRHALVILSGLAFALLIAVRLPTHYVSAQTGGACSTPSFGQGTNYPLPANTSFIVTGDFNQDGKPDVAATDYGHDSVAVLLGNGSGGLGAATSFSTGAGAGSIAAADFNNDGKVDLAVTNNDSKVSILTGNGSGGFGAPVSFGAGGSAGFVTTSDFNGDGKRDLAVTNSASISVLLGNGDGSFGTASDFPVESLPNAIAVADFNGDGKSDLAVSNFGSGTVSVLLGNGSGGFGVANNVAASINTSSVAAGDFNSDGKPDLVAVSADFFNGALLLLVGDGNGNFSAPVSTALQDPKRLAVADFNVDSKPDLVVTGSPGARVLLGNGSGGFAATAILSSSIIAVAAGDLNGDSKPDLLTAPTLAIPAYLTVFLNTCNVPKIEVTPSSLAFGSVTMGQTKDLTLTIRNTGSGALTVNSVTSSNSMFSAASPAAPFNVAAGEQQEVTVRFAPTVIASQTGTLSIASNDTADPTLNVALSGEGADPCTYALSPTSQSFDTLGGTGSVTVTAPGGCAWTAASNAAWLTITSGADGSGHGAVNYSAASNLTHAARNGTLTIAGKTFTLTQGV